MSDFDNRICSIYEFQSNDQGTRGNGRKTLQWLHQHFDRIDVIDPGEDGSDSRLFWNKMMAEGLVDGLYDDDHRPL